MKNIYYYVMVAFLSIINVYYGSMFYKMRNKEYVSEVYNILMRNPKIKYAEKILKFYGLFHFVIAALGLMLFFIKNLYIILGFLFVIMILDSLFFVIISKKSEKLYHILNLVLVLIFIFLHLKFANDVEITQKIYNISYTIVIENGDSNFKELKEKSHLEEILKSEIKNISKMKDKKIELYDQKGKLLIKSDLYEAEVKNSATNEYEKQENIIKYKGRYYKIYEPKKFDAE